jgi:hypothetical protein
MRACMKMRPCILRLAALAILSAVALSSTNAGAQRFTRIDVPRGKVSGLEMGIEGNLQAPPGGRVRWYVTVYEIVGGRKLRPAAATKLRALASFHRRAPVATATTDALGRARLEFEVPKKLEQSFQLVVEARSPTRVMRSFDVTVELGPRYRSEVFVDRTRLAPGAPLRAWGRVFDLARNRPSAKHEVRVRARRTDGALLGREHVLQTNAQGVFNATLAAPDAGGSFKVEALAERSKAVSRTLTAALAAVPQLVVYARARQRVVAPGTTVEVDVVVRTPEGRPVPRATLTGLSIPVPTKKDEEVPPVLTDARGRARVPWRVSSTDAIADVSGTIQALREGIGTGSATVRVRTARVPLALTWAAEGGALVPGLPSRVFVKASRPDGTPAAGLTVRLEGGRLKAAPGSTDRAGVAVIDATVAETDANAPSSCRGPTVAAATLQAGSHTTKLCLPVDPDSTLRVRTAPTVNAGGKLEVQLLARPSVARSPVAVTILTRAHDQKWRPVGQIIAKASRTNKARRVSLRVPRDAVGPIWIRARPLIGGERRAVRGGTAMAWSTPRRGHGLRVAPGKGGDVRVERTGGKQANNGHSAGFVLALPVAQGERLREELRRTRGLRPNPGAGVAEWMGFLAARTPVDGAVSAVLRGGARVTLAMPADAVAEGLLRDPWRSQARFVRGRLGRLLLAIEERVTQSIPDKLSDVAVRGRRGWRFNSEILTVVGVALGTKAVTGLDGSPLTITALQALDRHLTFDHVARRITRQRQLRLLVALKHFVRAKQLDYGWARRKSPASWLTALRDWRNPEGDGEDEGDNTIKRVDLFDAWGRPFKLRKARGARARFRFLEPIVGYELLSAGPDGRFGTRDDLFDPFARVLPAGSLYGEAVGEEALLARLRGVALGRATLAALAEAFKVQEPAWKSSRSSASTQSWDGPTPVKDTREALEPQAVRSTFPAAGRFMTLKADKGTSIKLKLSPEPRRYLVVAGAYDTDGHSAFHAEPLRAGAPLFIEAAMPPRLRPNEPLRVPVHIIGAGAPQQLTVQAQADGAINVAVKGQARFTLQTGESHSVNLQIKASRAGTGRVRLRILAADGSELRRLDHRLRATWDGSLRAQHVGAIVDGQARAELSPPKSARPVRSFLVVSAPRDLLRDPGFDELGREHPALLAWAHTIRGESMPATLAAELARRRGRQGSMPTLESACAAVAWSAASNARQADAPHPELGRALQRLRAASAISSMRERSALLVALSTSASMIESGTGGPVVSLVSAIRKDGWHALMTERSRPTVMARLAAGLLLADRRDVPGRELFNRGRAALVDGAHGGKVLPGDEGRAVDGWIGTLALALAARQLGENALARELTRGVAPRLYLAMGSDVEAGFWLLAASVYGVFGVHGPRTVEVEVNGKPQRLKLHRGVATLRLPRRRVRVSLKSSRPVLARLEARYVRPVAKTDAAAVSARMAGHAGAVGDTAALEVVVENRSEAAIARPVVEIMLPASAGLSASALSSMAGTAGVKRIERPDAQGLLRIHLTPLEAKQQRRLPLPVRWIGAGEVHGLSTTSYDADRPWRISSRPSRAIKLKARPKETWR